MSLHNILLVVHGNLTLLNSWTQERELRSKTVKVLALEGFNRFQTSYRIGQVFLVQEFQNQHLSKMKDQKKINNF